MVIESPYRASPTHILYLRAAMRDCLLRGESPYASHGLYTQPNVLDDSRVEERELGIQAGFAWRDSADITVVYLDLGISDGMKRGIVHAESIGQVVEYRSLPVWSRVRSVSR